MREFIAIPFFVVVLLASASIVKELRRIADALEAPSAPTASSAEKED